MLEMLLREEIRKYLRYQNIHDAYVDEDKLRMAVKKLGRYSHVTGHALRYLIRAFAYFYVQVYRETNFNKIYLKVTEFLDTHNMDISRMVITDEDVEDALDIERAWLDMNRFDVNTLPMHVRKLLSQSGVTVGQKTTFRYSRNYVCFAKIAHWINEHRRTYPQIHGYEEFFIHVPAMIGNGEYYPEDFFEIDQTIERYYKKAYGDIPKNKRFETFYETLHQSLKTDEALRKSNLFAASDILRRLKKESLQTV